MDGTVTWINRGSSVHTATTIGGAPLPFTTGGLGPGETTSFTFGTSGRYYYTSSTDCLNGVNNAAFPCSISYLVQVGPAPSIVPYVPATPTPQPAAVAPLPAVEQPSASGLPQAATLNITDTGISPRSVSIALNGSVTWIDQGGAVHTATSLPGIFPGFDTGGLGWAQSANVVFTTPGRYEYTSAPDCLNNSYTPGFDCGPYTVEVSSSPVIVPAAPTPVPTQAPYLAAPAPNTTVALDEVGGFQPYTLLIKAGQIVTWTNRGSLVHSVVSDPGYIPAFDSGGLAPGDSFSVTFSQPGSFGYHSSTEPIYSHDTSCDCTVTTYTLKGVVQVSS